MRPMAAVPRRTAARPVAGRRGGARVPRRRRAVRGRRAATAGAGGLAAPRHGRPVRRGLAAARGAGKLADRVRAAVLHEHGKAPQYGEFEGPAAGPGQVVVDVAAAALHHLDLLKASGTFYMGPPPLPSVVGTDGVGTV